MRAVSRGNKFVCELCDRQFRYASGILESAPEEVAESEESQIQQREEEVRDGQARTYDAALVFSLSSWLERRKIWAHLQTLQVSSALEVGCGTGRFTALLAQRAARVVAVDRSRQSLFQCRQRLRRLGLDGKVLLIREDANQMPARARSFDVALTAQMIQHLPSAGLREETVAHIAEALKPGGTLIFSGYEWRKSLDALRKQGFHRGGIPFVRFTEPELRELFGAHFEIDRVESSAGKLLVLFGRRPQSASDSVAGANALEPSRIGSAP